jgi:hypothetical protein
VGLGPGVEGDASEPVRVAPYEAPPSGALERIGSSRLVLAVLALLALSIASAGAWALVAGETEQVAVAAPPTQEPAPPSPDPTPEPDPEPELVAFESLDWAEQSWTTDCTNSGELEPVELEPGENFDGRPTLQHTVGSDLSPMIYSVLIETVSYGDVTGDGNDDAVFETGCFHGNYYIAMVEVWTHSEEGEPIQLPPVIEYTKFDGTVDAVELVDGHVRIHTSEGAAGDDAPHINGYPVMVVTDWRYAHRRWIPQEISRTDAPPSAPEPEPEPEPETPGVEEAALTFFRSTQGACAQHANQTGNEPIDSFYFDGASVLEVRQGTPTLVRIIDGAGTELFVVPEWGQVWGGPSPDDLMPRPYLFGCPEHIFVGTIHD